MKKLSKTNGGALFEVLISMSLMGFIVSALFLYEINDLKLINHNYLETIGQIQLNNFSEYLHADLSDSSREDDLLNWNKDNKNLLPNGTGDYKIVSDHICEISIQWKEKIWQQKKMDLVC